MSRSRASARPNDAAAGEDGLPDSALARIATGVALAVYAAEALGFAWLGRVNADEGWYLGAARRVAQGDLPYGDFAFTQMPLTPYVYAPSQLLASGLTPGRITSALLAAAAAWLCARSARRLAGPVAAASTALLLAALPAAIYWLALVKTYALTAFLFAATLAALVSRRPREQRDPLAVAAATGLALTRTSGLPLALLVVSWCVITAPSPRARRRSVAVATCLVAAAVACVLGGPEAARYSLLEIHQVWWYEAPLGVRVEVILTERIPEWLHDYAPIFLLTALAVGCVAGTTALRAFARANPAVLVFALGLGAFLAAHLPAGQFASVEYFAPAVPALLTLAAVALTRGLLGPGAVLAPPWGGRVLAVGMGAAAVTTLFHPSALGYLTRPGDPGSVAGVHALGSFVRAHTPPDAPVLALWSQDVAVAADRDNFPDVSVGLFSYTDLPETRARALRLVNYEMLTRAVRERRVSAVVLTDLDRGALLRGGTLSKRAIRPDAFYRALDAGYALARRGRVFGALEPTAVEIFLRRDATPARRPTLESADAQRAPGERSAGPRRATGATPESDR